MVGTGPRAVSHAGTVPSWYAAVLAGGGLLGVPVGELVGAAVHRGGDLPQGVGGVGVDRVGQGRAAGGVEDPVGPLAPAQLPCPRARSGAFAPVSGDVLAPPVQHGRHIVGGAELALGDGLDEQLAGVPAEQLRGAEGTHQGGPGRVGDRAVERRLGRRGRR